LRILRSPFPERNATSKGFMINESLKMAAGEWIVFLDSDVILPPDFFAHLGRVPKDANFIAPDGRKMLDPETTAKVLLGEIEPWRSWQDLLNGRGEYRAREAEGVPIGFCQVVRASCLDTVKYEEHENFEGADWSFGAAMRDAFGHEFRLSGVPVLHLDHKGSQWYGAQRHF
jgi:hypothetical protein